MEKPKRKIDYREHEEPAGEQFPDISNVASANVQLMFSLLLTLAFAVDGLI